MNHFTNMSIVVSLGPVFECGRVLFYDPDGTGEITERRQYVFTDWDGAATSDLQRYCPAFSTAYDGWENGGNCKRSMI